MESEIQNEHYEKKKPMIAIGNQLKRELGLFIFKALVHQLDIAIKSRSKAIRCHHEKRREVVIMGKTKYTEKCLIMFS